MDFALPDHTAALQDTARRFAASDLAPHAAAWDAGSFFPVETLRKAADLGFAGLNVGEEGGGSALTRLDTAVVIEELAKGCTSTAAYLSIHNMVGSLIDRFGHDELRAAVLPDLTSMRRLSSYCLTEPGSGSDAAALKTRAVADGNHFVLNGTKAFISGGGVSDVYLVMARTGGEGAAGVSAFLIDKDTPGLSFGANERKMGWKSQPTAQVHFTDCRVPADRLVGTLGQGFKIAMAGLDGGRINIAACSLGAAQACLDHTLAYVRERRQFGRPLADFQALQFRLADMATELEAARLMVHKAAVLLDRGDPRATLHSAMAKRFATDIGFQVVDQALQLHGGYGYLNDYPIERYFRDARVHQILEGTNEIMRVIIARHLLAH